MDEWKRPPQNTATQNMRSSPESDESDDGSSELPDWKNNHRTFADDANDLHTTLEDTKSEVPVVEEAHAKKHRAQPQNDVPTVPPDLLKAQAEDDVQGMNDALKAFGRARHHE